MEAATLRERPPPKAALVLRAARPVYLPTSGVPALAGLLCALHRPDVHWAMAPVILAAIFLCHLGTNLINEVEDFARGVDRPGKIDNSGVFTGGLMSVREGRAITAAFFAAALALGFVVGLVTGPALALLGVLGLLGGYLYTGGPRPYKYVGLGDAVIVPLMGPLLTLGAYTSITGELFFAPACWVGLGPGLLICAVLQGNNLSDLEGDAAAGCRTLTVRLGFQRGRTLFLVTLVLAYLAVPAVWLAGLFGPAILLPLVTVPIAVARARQALAARASGDPGLASLAPRSAQLHLLFCALLVVGVVLDRA